MKKALTIWNPWAWAITRGLKTVENRSQATAYRGSLLIHAGRRRGESLLLPDGTLVPEGELVYGALIGVADVVGCVRSHEVPPSPWVKGPWCWLLANARPLPAPVPLRGSPGLFDVPDGLAVIP